MSNTEREFYPTSTEQRSSIQIPTGFIEGVVKPDGEFKREFVDRNKERAILLAKVHDLAKGEQLRNRFKYFLWGIPTLVVSLLGLVIAFLISEPSNSVNIGILIADDATLPESLLVEADHSPAIMAGIFGGLCIFAIFLIRKGLSSTLRPVSLQRVYLTHYIIPYDSDDGGRSSLVFDANSIQAETELKYDEIDSEKIAEISKLQSTIDNLEHTFENERLVANRLSEIDNIVESQTSININSRTVKADSFVIKGIKSVISLGVPGSPAVELGSLDFGSDDAQSQALEIHALETRGKSIDQLNRIKDRVSEVSVEFTEPLNREIAEIETFGSFVHNTQRDRWVVAQVEENAPEFDNEHYGFNIGRYKAIQGNENEHRDTLLGIPHKIIDTLQRKITGEMTDLKTTHERDVQRLQGETDRKITADTLKSDKAVGAYRIRAQANRDLLGPAVNEHDQALLRREEARGWSDRTATENRTRMSAINQANKRIDKAVIKISELDVKIKEAERNAEMEEDHTRKSIASMQATVEKQISGTTSSLGEQLRSKMTGIGKIINVRDKQLDLTLSFLKHSLPEEFASHARPFVLRRSQLLEPATKIQREIGSRIDNLNQVLGHIDNLKASIAIDRPVAIHIPFWILHLVGGSEKHIHVFTPSRIEKGNVPRGNWLKEKMGATQYLNDIKPISTELAPLALALLARVDRAGLMQESIQIPFAQEDSGVLTAQLDDLAREGLISERYATRVAKFWSGKSVGPDNKVEGKTLAETVFVDYKVGNIEELLRGYNGNDIGKSKEPEHDFGEIK